MKKLALLNILLLVAVVGTANAGSYSGGTGEPNDPYRIATAEDLNDIGNHSEDWDKHFLLVADINLADYTGTQFNIISKFFDWHDPNNEPFTGVFDGNGHSISNFTYISVESDSIGLFRLLGSLGEVKNVALENVNIDAGDGDWVGALAGICEGRILGCTVAGSVSGEYRVGGLLGQMLHGAISDSYAGASVTGNGGVGGLVGSHNYGVITHCCATGSVTGGDGSGSLGGLVGLGYDGTISNCYATGSVTGGYDSHYLGGLVGSDSDGTISNCYATGMVAGGLGVGGLVGDKTYGTLIDCHSTGPVMGDLAVGGLVGENSKTIVSRSYASGEVTGGSWVGGLVGRSYGSDVTDCYATGAVAGNWDVGGLVGRISDSHIVNCYAAGTVNGNGLVGGLVGLDAYVSYTYTKCFWDSDVNPDANGIGNWADPNVTGKRTPEMQQETTFTDAGWDFVEIWDIGENQTYPFLRTHPAGDINHDDKVNFLDLAILASHWLE